MAKIIKKISDNLRFSKRSKADGRRSFMAFVESFVEVVDPKDYNI